VTTRLSSRLILLVTWCFVSAFALAAEPIILRTSVSPEEAWLGQKVVLHIDVLAKDGWAQLKKTGDAEVHGAYLLRLETQGTRLSETIDGDSYTGQRYEFMLFAQRAGEITIPPVPVEVEVKRWGAGAESATHRLATPNIVFVARTPPGAENIRGLVTTTSLIAEQKWQPELASAAVGDAIKRTITLRADDVSGIAFTPMLQREIENLGIYPGEPTVEDKFARGELTGTRIETVTYVFERPGAYELPSINYTWWDVRNQELKSIELPGLALQVSGSVATESIPANTSAQQKNTRLMWLALLAFLVTTVIAFRSRGRIADRWTAWRMTRSDSEAAYFRRVLRSLRSGDRETVLRETMRWLDRINDEPRPERLDEFMRRYGDAGSQSAARGLSGDRTKLDVAALRRGLQAARKNWLQTQRTSKRAAGVLPGLNSAG